MSAFIAGLCIGTLLGYFGAQGLAVIQIWWMGRDA